MYAQHAHILNSHFAYILISCRTHTLQHYTTQQQTNQYHNAVNKFTQYYSTHITHINSLHNTLVSQRASTPPIHPGSNAGHTFTQYAFTCKMHISDALTNNNDHVIQNRSTHVYTTQHATHINNNCSHTSHTQMICLTHPFSNHATPQQTHP